MWFIKFYALYLVFLICVSCMLEALMNQNDPTQGRVMLEKAILTDLSKSKSYKNFLVHIFPKSIGAKKWPKQLGNALISENSIVTVSNEAFALVVLANNWDTWLEPAKLLASRYTNGASNRKREGSTAKYSGWSDEGMCTKQNLPK